MLEKQVELKEPHSRLIEGEDVVPRDFFPRPPSPGNIRKGIENRENRFVIKKQVGLAPPRPDFDYRRGNTIRRDLVIVHSTRRHRWRFILLRKIGNRTFSC